MARAAYYGRRYRAKIKPVVGVPQSSGQPSPQPSGVAMPDEIRALYVYVLKRGNAIKVIGRYDGQYTIKVDLGGQFILKDGEIWRL